MHPDYLAQPPVALCVDRHILEAVLAVDPGTAFNGLGYVIAPVVSLGIASEGEVKMTFWALFSMCGAQGENTRRKLHQTIIGEISVLR